MLNMKKVVYITGCLGFIGSYVTRKCLEKGWYVRGIDKATYAANFKNIPINIDIRQNRRLNKRRQ